MKIDDRKRRLLILVICLAVGLHLAFIYSLHDLSMEFLGRNGAIVDEKPIASLREVGQEEINKHLAHVFRDFSQHAIASDWSTTRAPLAEIAPPAMDLVALDFPSFENVRSSFDLTAHDLPKNSLEAMADGLLGNVQLSLPELLYDELSVRVGNSDLGAISGSVGKAYPALSHTAQEPSGSMANSGDFDVTLEYAPKADEQGITFRVTLTPRGNVLFKTIAQNVVFLIDRSHSIDKERYAASKAAVIQALQTLRPEDQFNILVFDDRVTPFATQMSAVTFRNIESARQFLQGQAYGGMFASTDLYSSLGNIIPDIVGSNEVNAAILLSDGDTFLSKDKQRRSIASWTDHNQGKVALFCVTAGSGNNLPLLDFLAAENKGALVHARSSVAEALARLMNQIRRPIAKDIVASAVARSPGVGLSLYPPLNRQPHLYQQKPYVFYGHTDSADDFHLFLQGKYYDSWLDIQQFISFQQGTQVQAAELEQGLALQQAYDLYEDYLKTGSSLSLSKARRLLHTHNLPLAFH